MDTQCQGSCGLRHFSPEAHEAQAHAEGSAFGGSVFEVPFVPQMFPVLPSVLGSFCFFPLFKLNRPNKGALFLKATGHPSRCQSEFV